jgi:hypothetical protein
MERLAELYDNVSMMGGADNPLQLTKCGGAISG